jgi:hypothetical protein
MCGPFVLAVAGKDRWRGLGRQAVYHAGKATTYLFLGLLAGLLGRQIDRHASQIFPVQTVLSWAAAVVLLIIGLQLLGVFRFAPGLNRFLSGERWMGLCGRFDPSGSMTGAMGLGLLNGFMPCPLVVGALAAAAGAGTIVGGLGYMLALALATTPALLILAVGGTWIRSLLNRRGVRIAGALMLVLSAVALLRPTQWIHAAMGHDHAEHEHHQMQHDDGQDAHPTGMHGDGHATTQPCH